MPWPTTTHVSLILHITHYTLHIAHYSYSPPPLTCAGGRVIPVSVLWLEVLRVCDPLEVTSQIIFYLLLLTQLLEVSSWFCLFSFFWKFTEIVRVLSGNWKIKLKIRSVNHERPSKLFNSKNQEYFTMSIVS